MGRPESTRRPRNTRLRRIARGIGRWTLRVVVALVALMIVALATLLYSERALRGAAGIALDAYNARIPGSITVASIDGRLVDALHLRGLVARDRAGRALIAVDALDLRWSAWALLDGAIDVDALALAGVRINLTEGAGFSDLAPPAGEPAPPRETFGPRLPLDLRIAAIDVDDAAIVDTDGEAAARGIALALRDLAWSGAEARARLVDARGELPGVLTVTGATIDARWSEPTAAIEAEIVSDLGVATIASEGVDLQAIRGGLAVAIDLRRRAARERLAAVLGERAAALVGDPSLRLLIDAEDGALSLGLRARAPGIGELALAASGPPRGAPTWVIGGHARLSAPALLGPRAGPLESISPVLLAMSEGTSVEDLRASLTLAAPALADLEVAAALTRAGPRLDAALDLRGAGVDLAAAATIVDEALTDARWRLEVPEVARLVAVVDRFVAIPALTGRLQSAGRCRGEDPRCAADLVIRRFAGAGARVAALDAELDARPLADARAAAVELRAVDVEVGGAALALVDARVAYEEDMSPGTGSWITAEVDAHGPATRDDRLVLAAQARLGDAIEVAVDALDLRLAGLDAHLERPTRVTVDGRELTVDDLALAVAGGRIDAAGTLDRDGASDLEVSLTDLHLGRLRRLIPRLRLAGRVDARGRIAGPADAPTLGARATARGLVVGGAAIGDLSARVDLDEGEARGRVDLAGALARRAVAVASTPLRVDLGVGSVSVPRDRIMGSIAILGLDLAEVGALTPSRPRLAGVVDVRAEVEGEASQPRVALHVDARDLALAGHDLGDARLTATADGRVSAALTARRRGARLEVDAPALPIDLDLTRGGARLRRGDRIDVTVTAEGIDLRRQLAGLDLDDAPITGHVGLRAAIHGPLRAPSIALGVAAEGLRARDLGIGELRLEALVADDRATVDLRVDGAVARDLRLTADLPVRLAPLAGEYTWLQGQEQRASLDVARVDLACLGRLGIAPALTGSATIDADLRGRADDPAIDAQIGLRGLRWDDRAIGEADLDLDVHDQRARVDVRAAVATRTRVRARADAPITLDLARGAFGLDDDARADLEVAVDHLDRDALALAAPSSKGLLLDAALRLEAGGSLDDFDAGLTIDGALGHAEVGRLPLHVGFGANESHQRVDLSLGRGDGSLHVRVDARADVPALARGRADPAKIAFDGALTATSIDLRSFEAALPEALLDLEGSLRADLTASGTIGAPSVDGELALARGAVTVLPLQQRLSAIDAVVRARGREITVERLAAASGPGRLHGEGSLEIDAGGGLRGRGEVSLRDFPLVRPGLPQMLVATRVRAELERDDDETALELAVSDTEVTITGVNAPAPAPIPESDAVTYVDQRARRSVAVDASPPPGEVAAFDVTAPIEPEAPPGVFTLAVELREPVEIDGPATVMRWRGSVTATTRGPRREVVGELSADRGHIDLLGNRFTIESGSVTLPEDDATLDPFIFLVARSPTSAGLVTATFRGRLSRPELRFSADPPMSQSAILSLLVTGSADASQADEGAVLAKAASLLASFQNPALSQYLDRKLGVDRVGLGFGEGVNQPIITVGKRVSRDLYVETALRVNAPPRQNRVEVRAEYEFLPRWTLETFFGDAAIGGLDVFWGRVYGAPSTSSSPSSKSSKSSSKSPSSKSSKSSSRSSRSPSPRSSSTPGSSGSSAAVDDACRRRAAEAGR